MNRNATAGTIQGIPVEHLSTMGAGSFFFLPFHPFLNPVILHKLQIIDHLFMVPDAVHHMDLGKILQPFAGKVRALEAPGYFLFLGTATETVPAVLAGGIDVVGKTPVASNFFDGDPIGLGYFF